MLINFVMLQLKAYWNVVQEMSEPVRFHISNSVVNTTALNDAVNVHFFAPGDNNYSEKVDFDKGVKVFLPHGISDKGYRTGESLKEFDFICVSGPFWAEKLTDEGIPGEKIFIGGYPKLDSVFTKRKTLHHTNIKPIVLYAPTHTNSAVCAYSELTEDMIKLPSYVDLITSLHPYNNLDHLTTTEQLIHADVVISDIGSLVWEAWALGIPVVFPDWVVKDRLISALPTTLTAHIYREGIGYHADSLEELPEQVCKAIDQGITEAESDLINRVFPAELRGISGKATAEHLLHIASETGGFAV
ncbi:MAG: hypothetical protein ACM3PE_11570 [Deltaproteobacteria bacterium]